MSLFIAGLLPEICLEKLILNKLIDVLYLIRHCSTQDNDRGILCSSKDPGLSETGIAQSKKLAKWFANKQITKIYSSPALRARMTATAIGAVTGANVETNELLVERRVPAHFSDMDNSSLVKLRQEYGHIFQDVSQDWQHVDDVESDETVHSRIRQMLDHKEKDHIALVTHAGTIKAFLYGELNIRHFLPNAFKVANGCILRMSYRGNPQFFQMNGIIQITDHDD